MAGRQRLLSPVTDRADGTDLVTSVAASTLRGPILLLSAAATIDAMAEGRVILGVGAASSRADDEAAPPPSRAPPPESAAAGELGPYPAALESRH